jgi:hypothetical protein
MSNRVPMVWTWGFEEFLEVVGGFLGLSPSSRLACHCHQRIGSLIDLLSLLR